MNMKKKSNAPSVKGINVISSFFERGMNICHCFPRRPCFFLNSLIKNRNVIKLFIYFLEYLLHKSQRVGHH
jgi:hypothetical protein